jgi:ABC-type uncharacterized transport system permease subunit
MTAFVFGLAAIALYVIAAVQTSALVRVEGGTFSSDPRITLCAAAAATLHAIALYPMAVTPAGLNLGIFTAASLVAWMIVVVVIAASLRHACASLAIVILPFSAFVLALSLAFSHPRVVHASPGLTLHVALSLLAYSLFAIAALQALYLAFAAHRLKSHAPILRLLPPLATMETVMFQLTALAFALLTIGLVLGAAYISDVRGQHLAHKIAFSLAAWLTFGVLLLGRWRWQWRGRRAVRYVVAGFALLALGFFGSKIALELILHRA